jgi:phosphatidylserine/phosphatidylglycerophosphate/cardiolipin synthase-like enzyme
MTVVSGGGRQKSYKKMMLASAARRTALRSYLLDLLYYLHMHISTEVCEFLELSRLTVVPGVNWKGKEGYLLNRIERPSLNGTDMVRTSWLCSWRRDRQFERQWFVIRESYLTFTTTIDSMHLQDVILCDNSFKLDIQNAFKMLEPWKLLSVEPATLEDTGTTSVLETRTKGASMPRRFIVSNSGQRLEVKAEKDYQIYYWIQSLLTLSRSPYCQIHRFGAFAPVRQRESVHFFIDSAAFYSCLYHVLSSAKREIFIQGWWVSPQLYLLRPPSRYPESRLDMLLQKKAQEGVNIYILIYKEVTVALPLDSAYTKAYFSALHPNIKVQRHPDHNPLASDVVFYWGHHEKIIVVDQMLSFIGGLDLCYGRYDTPDHMLLDIKENRGKLKFEELFPLQDLEADHFKEDSMASVNQQLSHSESSDLPGFSNSFDSPLSHTTVAESLYEGVHGARAICGNLSKLDGQLKADIEAASVSSPVHVASSNSSSTYLAVWQGMDYSNPRIRDFRQVRDYELLLLDKTIQPRMPWHDVHCLLVPNSNPFFLNYSGSDDLTEQTSKCANFSAARDVARHFIEKWNFVRRFKSSHKAAVIPFLTPDESAHDSSKIKNLLCTSIGDIVADVATSQSVSVQILRSSSEWSLGTQRIEKSIQEAYLHAIRTAQSFIYIENQFFITANEPSSPFINQIGNALYERILSAHECRLKLFL